jgi:RNA polymerase sigma-70 factor (ECF subfamily)
MEERDLIRRCIDRDNTAWKTFLESYGGCIYGSVRALLARYDVRQQEVTEDIFARVIEKLLRDDCRALRRFNWRSRFTTWLVSVSRNQTYDYLRTLKRRPTVSLHAPVDDDDTELEKLLAADLDLDGDLEARLTAEEALARLREKDRLVLRLYYLEGMKEREIAALLKVSVDAVSARKSRALKKLRELVGSGEG